MTMTGGAFSSVGRHPNGDGSGGLIVRDLTLSGGTLNATGVLGGVSIDRTLTMSGTLNATATSKDPSGDAIYLHCSTSGSKMEVTGGTLRLSGDHLIRSNTNGFPVSLKNMSLHAASAPRNVFYSRCSGVWTLDNVTFVGYAASINTANLYASLTVKNTTLPASDGGIAFTEPILLLSQAAASRSRSMPKRSWSKAATSTSGPTKSPRFPVHIVRINGGTVKARGSSYGISSGEVRITGTPDVEVVGNLKRFPQGSVTINGSPFAQDVLNVLVVDGVLEKAYNPLLSLFIDGEQYDLPQLTADRSGTGWEYEAASNALKLNGYGGGAIAIGGDPVIVLSGSNTAPGLAVTRFANIRGSGSLVLTGGEGLSVRGLKFSQASLTTPLIASAGDSPVQIDSGTIDADESRQGRLTLAGGLLLSGDIQAGGAFISSGGTGTAGLIMAAGNVTVAGGSLNCVGLVSTGGNVSMTGGSLKTEGAPYGLAAVGGTVSITGGTLKAFGMDLVSGVGVFCFRRAHHLRNPQH